MLPPIRLVTASPLIVPGDDGVRVLLSGYDADEKVLVLEGAVVPEVLDFDTARAALLSLFDDFLFQSPGDKARAAAMLLTPALKIGGLVEFFAPLDVFEA